ncbi:hypothetical protein SeW_A4765 [Salmonella enterica subsp. enterica serovar Weltevreden str. HI_N05-537]|nr:hypothetical protein SeW_A4765 [Salmonella enterica subsp. enterica serovar Weltevreden str. HI_N05-537]
MTFVNIMLSKTIGISGKLKTEGRLTTTDIMKTFIQHTFIEKIMENNTNFNHFFPFRIPVISF